MLKYFLYILTFAFIVASCDKLHPLSKNLDNCTTTTSNEDNHPNGGSSNSDDDKDDVKPEDTITDPNNDEDFDGEDKNKPAKISKK